MTDTVTLKPCPFCGGDELSHGWDSPGWDGSEMTGNVECHGCRSFILADDEREAIAAWNTRTDGGAATPMVEEALGRFGHHPDPATDFGHEVECCENDAYDLRGDIGVLSRGQLLLRIERAMTFRVGGDQGAIAAKRSLRDLEKAMKEGREREYIDGVIAARRSRALSATPAQEVNETERLREAAQALLDGLTSTYTARNGREVGIQGDDGEKCYIVHSDLVFDLRAALAPEGDAR